MTVLYPSFRFTTTVFDLFYALSVCTPFRSWLAGISGMLMSKGISRFAFIVLWEYHWEPESLLFRRSLRLSDPLLILFVVILLHITAWLTFWILQ